MNPIRVPNPLLEQVVPPPPVAGIRQVPQLEAIRRVQAAAAASRPPSTAGLPCLLVEIVDQAKAKDLFPLLVSGSVVVVAHALTTPMVVGGAFRLSPASEGAEPTTGDYLDSATYGLLLKATGHDDDGSRSAPEWAAKGITAAREFLRHAPPAKGVHLYSKARDVFESGAVAIARSYGASPSECAELIGHTVPFPRRSLLAPLAKADSLTTEVEAQKAAAARAAEEATRAYAERNRVNTSSLDALGLDGIVVPNFTGNLWQGVPKALEFCSSYWHGGDLVFVWRKVPGLTLPQGVEFAGCKVAPPTLVLGAPAREIEATIFPVDETMAMIGSLLDRMSKGDRGPIAEDTWTTDGIETAEAIVKKWAHLMHPVPVRMAWLPSHFVALTVRGCLVRPDRAAAAWWDELQRMHAAQHGFVTKPKARRPIDLSRPADPAEPFHAIRKSSLGIEKIATAIPPYSGGVGREALMDMAAAAAAGGLVSSGSMLPTKDEKPVKGRK